MSTFLLIKALLNKNHLFMRTFGIIMLLFLTLSCSKEYGYEIDSELLVYFDMFEVEGAERGFEIDLEAEGIGGVIDFIRDGYTVGQCQTSTEGNRRILVDEAFWSSYSEMEKQFIVFHELGHCYLGREHTDESDSQNNCTSIMQSGLGECRNNFTESTREELLDELFSK